VSHLEAVVENWYEADIDLEVVKTFRSRATHAFAREKDIVNVDTGEAIPYFGADEALRRARVVLDVDGALGDRLATMIGGGQDLIVNAKTHAKIGGLRLCPTIRWIPTEIVDGKGALLAEYHWAYGFREHDVWDLGRSNCLYVDAENGPGKKFVTVLGPGVLLASVAPPYDLFRANDGGWICTQAFKDAIEHASVTGFSFIPLSVTG
jgi:hypothetical protein